MSFLQNTANRTLFLLTALAVALNLGRAVATHQTGDLYLSWNIFLALLPFAVSTSLLWYSKQPKVSLFVLVFGLLVWLALFPNAPYLLTDFIHVRNGAILSIWYNIIMFFSAAWVGLFAAFYSLSHIETLLGKYFKKLVVWVLLSAALIVSSFGIYIGRFLRWNSWDVFVNPRELVADIWIVFTKSGQHQDAFFFTFIFFIFMLVSYIALRTPNREFASTKV